MPLDSIALNDIIGNLSYLILAASFFVTSIYWLRIWAAVAMALEIVYFCMTSWDLYTGVAWDVVFIAINLYRLGELTARRRGIRHMRDLGLLRSAFAGLDDGQLAMIVMAGQWTRFDAGGRLLVEGRSDHRMHLICSGQAIVHAKGFVLGRLEPLAMAGSTGFLIDAPADHSVVAETPLRALSFEKEALAMLCSRDPHLACAIYRLMGRDLARRVCAGPPALETARIADQLSV